MNTEIFPKKIINGRFTVPGDKSISHRAVMFSALAEGTAEIDGFLTGEDCLSTIDCFRNLGINIEQNGTTVTVYGKGLNGLSKPSGVLYAGNSGTTVRLMSGILSGQPFSCEITGDSSIQKRPMDRVITPLRQMGAKIFGANSKSFAPLTINPSKLKGITYELPVASAQVKSAILLASLFAESETTIIEPEKTRDHTEIMLNHLGANIETNGNTIISRPVKQLFAKNIKIPGDISSAAFLIVAALILPDSHIIIENIGVNETRIGIITALKEMGGNISLLNERAESGEPVADIEVKSSELKGITIGGSIIPKMIDEIPVLSVAALFAKGKTIIKDAAELKVKESNRIKTMSEELGKLGAQITETDDGMIITGGHLLKGANVESHNDHRVAMSLAIAALRAEGSTKITGAECTDISFPGFWDIISNL